MKIETPGCTNLVLPHHTIKHFLKKVAAFCLWRLGLYSPYTENLANVCMTQGKDKWMSWHRGGGVGCTNKVWKLDEGPYVWVSLEYLEFRCQTSP